MREGRELEVPPRGWEERRLGDVAQVSFSNVDKKSRPRDQKVRLCNYMDVYSNDYIHDALRFMEATASPTEIQRFGLREGDVIITKDSETPDDIGISAVVRPVGRDVVCGYHLALIRPKSGTVHSGFLGKQLRTDRLVRYFAKEANGSTRYGLSTASVTGVPVWLAPLTEQSRIAAILDAIDEVIRKTEQLIAKLQMIKQGLLDDLLTRGIDGNGGMRDPERHPEQFKDSPVGRLPKEWGVSDLGDLCLRITYGFTNPMPTAKKGPWMLTAADVGYDDIFYGSARHTTGRAFELLTGKSKPERGDILVTKDGTLGRVALLDVDNVCVNQSVAVLRPRNANLSRFLVDYLLSPPGQNAMLAERGGSTIGHIYITRLAVMPVPVPPPVEAARITAVVRQLVHRLRTEEAEAAKLRTLKQGLVDDLLTGRVRVSGPEEST